MSRVLPIDEKSELAVIACCVTGGIDTAIEAIERVPSQCFTRDDCRKWFSMIEEFTTQGRHLSGATLESEWWKENKRALPEHFEKALSESVGGATLDYYGKKVVDAWRRRKILYALEELQTKAYDMNTTVEDALSAAESVLGEQEILSITSMNGQESARALIEDMSERFNLQGRLSGTSTGFDDLDALTDGLQAGEQTVIAARPSVGKTAIGLNILETACFKNGIPTLFVSCEMSVKALCRRLMSSWSRLSMGAIRSGKMNNDDQAKIATFNGKLKSSPVHFLEAIQGAEMGKIGAATRRACRKFGIKLVVIDYLQKIKSRNRQEKRTYEVGEVSGELKALAVQTNAAFVTLAQLNRESEKDKGRIPKLSDLADSGQIERDADTVGLLHRNRAENEGRDAKLIIAKQRDGETGLVNLYFDGKFCRFENSTGKRYAVD
jgi:replicative DNA helicase